MALNFIYGASGAGKSRKAHEILIKSSMDNLKTNHIILVPEQFTMQTQKDIVTLHQRHGILNIDVLSFMRLAYRILDETGGNLLPVISEEGKNLIIKKVSKNIENELTVLGKSIDKIGVISEIKSTISEFMQYGISEDDIDDIRKGMGDKSKIYYKLGDIALIYREFKRYMEGKYITSDGVLDILESKIVVSDILKDSVIVLDGYTGFTPVQVRIIGELLKYAKDIYVTVTIDEFENPSVYENPYQLFALSKQTVATLIKVAKDNKVPINEPIEMWELNSYTRHKDNRGLSYLERNLFRNKRTESKEELNKPIKMAAYDNPKLEAHALASSIRREIRKNNLRYKDIGVIVSDMNTYGEYIKEAFEEYNLLTFMDYKRNILWNSFIEYIRSLLSMLEDNFSFETVFRFLRSEFSGFSNEEIDVLENYARGLNIRGVKKYQAPFIRRLKWTDSDTLANLNNVRIRFIDKLSNLLMIKSERSKTVRDVATILHDFLRSENLQVKIANKEVEFRNNGNETLAKEYSQVYRVVIELLDQLVLLLGDERISLSEFAKLFDAGLEETKIGVIPPSIDTIVVGDIERTRLAEIKVLFFVGANEDFLPGNLAKSGLLSERDRRVFRNTEYNLSPSGAEKAFIQKYYLYMHLSKPSERLYISYSKRLISGKPGKPSYLINEINSKFRSLVIEEDGEIEYTKSIVLEMFANEVRNALDKRIAISDKAKEIYAWLLNNAEDEVNTLLRYGLYGNHMKNLGKSLAEKLYGEKIKDSISRMEKFAVCPFAHFLSYGLDLKEQEEYEVSPIDMGNICHKALEVYASKLLEKNLSWGEVKEDERNQIMEEAIAISTAAYGNSIFASSFANEHKLSQIKELLGITIWALTSQLEVSDFRPIAVEKEFGNGKIDRIDICEEEDKVYVKVIDYKTGYKNFDILELYYGLQLQLPIYLRQAMKMVGEMYKGKEILPAAMLYYNISDPIIKDEDNKSLLSELRPKGKFLNDGDAILHFDKDRGTYSEVVPVRITKDGKPYSNDPVYSEGTMEMITSFANEKIGEYHTKIMEGDTSATPYKKIGKSEDTGCKYCPYKSVCGFDERVPGYEYRELKSYKAKEKEEKVISLISNELKKEEE